MARRVTTAALLSVVLVLAAGCFGGGGEASETELVDTLLTSTSSNDALQAAEQLASAPGCAAAQRIARTPNQRARALLRDQYATLARAPTSDPATKTHAVTCIATFDDKTAAQVVVRPLLVRSNTKVRAAAAKALPTMRRSAPSVVKRLAAQGSTETGARAKELSQVVAAIGPPAVPALLPTIVANDWAIDTLVLIGEPAVAPLRARYRSSNFRVSAAAATALLRLRTTARAQVQPLVPEIIETMIEHIGSFSIQGEAMDVLAEAGRPAVDPLVAWARKDPIYLSDRERRIQGSAELALAMIGTRSAKAVAPLLAALRRRDYGFIADLAGFYIQLGLGEKELIAGLNSQGDIGYLFDLISSGNPRLDRAAREWAPRHGYTITGRQTGPGAWAQLELGKG
jgi:hypothetical protein